MKTESLTKRILAVLLAFSMIFGMAACGKPEKTSQLKAEEEMILPKDEKEEYTREEMEIIVDLMGDGESTEDLTDEELKELVDKLVSSTEKDSSNIVNLSTPTDKKEPAVDMAVKDEFYGEDGEIKIPFDQIYPDK